LVANLRLVIKAAQKAVHSIPAQVALHQSEIDCHTACQTLFAKTEIQLRTENGVRSIDFQPAVKLAIDAIDRLAIGKDIAVSRDESELNEAEKQPSQSTKYPLDKNNKEAQKRRNDSANRENDRSMANSQALATQGGTDKASAIQARVRHSPHQLRDRGATPNYTK
jgi:hypothetical protein